MGKTSTIRARIEPDLKGKAEFIFQQLGLTTTQAITLFYKQVELKKGLPFEVAIPNETTRKTFSTYGGIIIAVIAIIIAFLFGRSR